MEAKKLDIAVIAITIIMYFMVNVFNTFSKQYYFENMIMLSILFAIILISYFSEFVISLITVVIIIFFYGSYTLYGNVVLGKSVEFHVYFWFIMLPIAAVISAIIGNKIRSIQRENEKLKDNYSSLVTIDQNTGLNNQRVFFIVMNQFMSLAKRHKIPLTLMIIKFLYYNDIRNIVGEYKIQDILKDVGEQLAKSTRMEDCNYILEDGKTFAMLLFTDRQGADIVKDRIRENINNYNLDNSSKSVSIKIELKIGLAQYNDEIKDIIEFKRLAEKDMEYDV